MAPLGGGRLVFIDRLRTLLTVADLGSFVAAATVLDLDPTTVTLRVAQLEPVLEHAFCTAHRLASP